MLSPRVLLFLQIWRTNLPRRRLPALLLNHLGGGGALDFVQGIETGKCVVVLTRQEAVSALCCASIGGTGKLACFKPVRDCTVNSHGPGREKGREQFGPGIYLIAPGDRRVFASQLESWI